MFDSPFWTYWYFHLPNYLVAALIYTLLGRFLMGLFAPADWDNYIWRFFVRVSDPVLRVFRPITPGFVPTLLLPLVAVFWLYVARLAYWMVLFQFALHPRLAGLAAAG